MFVQDNVSQQNWQTKLMTDSESTTKINVRSDWALFRILLTLAIIYKQRFLHENETVEYL